jgi:hypothetical protein
MQNISLTNQLKERLQNYSSVIENTCIDYASYIVEIGALTVGTDEKGKVIAQNVLYPTQFSEKAVAVILSMNSKNGNGENIEPVVFFKNDWYRQRITVIKETLELLIGNPFSIAKNN